MNEKEKYFIDLSKCSEEQRKHIFSLLPNPKFDYQHDITEEDFKLHISANSWWVLNNYEVIGKTELTYPEFIKLFEGGEGEKEIDIEKMAKEALKFQHKNIQDRMIDFVLGFEEGFKKAMELNSKQ